MSDLPEWFNVSSVRLSEDEKNQLLEICSWLKLKCKCNEVDQCGTKCQYYCVLCSDIVNNPEPQIFINGLVVGVRKLFESEFYKQLQIKMARPRFSIFTMF